MDWICLNNKKTLTYNLDLKVDILSEFMVELESRKKPMMIAAFFRLSFGQDSNTLPSRLLAN